MPEINTTFTNREVLIALRKSGWDSILPEEDSLDNPDEMCVEFTTTSEVGTDEIEEADEPNDDDEEDDYDEDDEDEDDEDDEDGDDEPDTDTSLTMPSAAVLSTWKSLD